MTVCHSLGSTRESPIIYTPMAVCLCVRTCTRIQTSARVPLYIDIEFLVEHYHVKGSQKLNRLFLFNIFKFKNIELS